MRILSIGNFTTGWDGSICDEEHIAGALEELGHSVARVQRETAYDDIVKNWGNPMFDFILIAQWDNYDERLWAMLPHPRVYWAFDYQNDGQEWHERLIAESDLYLSKPISDSKYSNWRWLSQDFTPDFLWETADLDFNSWETDYDREILFTGSWVPWESGKERAKLLKTLDDKYDLHIYGVTPEQWKAEGFKNVYGPVVDEAMKPLVRRSKINFSMDHVYAPGYWSDRNAQIMACQGFCLFRYVPLSETIWHDQLSYFYNSEDCLEKVDYWLNHDHERRVMANRGYNQTLWNCTVAKRVQNLLTIVGEVL